MSKEKSPVGSAYLNPSVNTLRPTWRELFAFFVQNDAVALASISMKDILLLIVKMKYSKIVKAYQLL